MLTLGVLTMMIFLIRFLVFNFQESPTFLISQGKDTKAIEILGYIASFNKTSPPEISIQDFRALEYMAPPSTGAAGRKKSKETLDLGVMFGHLKGLVDSPKHVWLLMTMIVA